MHDDNSKFKLEQSILHLVEKQMMVNVRGRNLCSKVVAEPICLDKAKVEIQLTRFL